MSHTRTRRTRPNPHDPHFHGPKAICKCGHTGVGPKSQHATQEITDDADRHGLGACMVPGCSCTRFYWQARTPAFDAYSTDRHNHLAT